jgi:hypothetical protein
MTAINVARYHGCSPISSLPSFSRVQPATECGLSALLLFFVSPR